MTESSAADQLETHQVPPLFREAAFEPGTVNEEARTVEVVWTTGSTVRRRRFMGDFEEELVVNASAIRLNRLNAGAPLLDTHNRFDLRGVVGTVERAWLAKGEGRAEVRFSTREEVEPIWRDVVGGIIRNISVGYVTHRVEITENESAPDLHRVVDWEPFEISLVPIGADPGASVRSQGEMPCVFVRAGRPTHSEEGPMKDKTDDKGTGKAASDDQAGAGTQGASTDGTRSAEDQSTDAVSEGAAPVVDQAAVQSAVTEALTEERTRVTEIRSMVRSLGLGDDVGEDLVSRGMSLDKAREEVITKAAGRQAETETRSFRIEPGESFDDPESIAARMSGAMAARYSPHLKMEESFRDFAGMTAIDMAATYLRATGRLTGYTLNRVTIVERALHSTSDFPILLADAANKMLLAEYSAAQPTFQLISNRRTFKDFKPHRFNRLGDFPNLLEKGEHGEFQSGTISETGEQVTLVSYGRIIGVTRETLINDDLGAFADLSMKYGRRVPQFQNDAVFAVLNNNPALSDAVAVFHANHGNLAGSGGAISVATIGAGRAAMRKQTGIDGVKLNITPAILLTGPDKETEAEQFVATNLVPRNAGDVNPFAGRLQAVGDANLSGNGWYLFASPASHPDTGLIYGFLEGEEGPRVATRDGWSVEGVELRVALDFTAGWVDYRGAYKNAGA